jgi:Domain of unknown function (DUF4918)
VTFSDHVLRFYRTLHLNLKLPEGVEVLNPYQEESTFQLCEKFYRKFYSDNRPRTLILGINPGRFGGGITGIPFTDPIKLEVQCGIPNELEQKVELSADFIYTMINAYGGPEKFYSTFYIGAVSPLGFVKDGKNLNYYDIKVLQQTVEPFIIDSIRKQLEFGINRQRCYCLGEGKNFDYLNFINKAHQFFKEIVPLPHPRFIMQYRRKSVLQYVDNYLDKLMV